MNILVNAFSDFPSSKVITNICNNLNCSYCHFIRVENYEIMVSEKCETDYQDWHNIILGKYDVDWNMVTPLDESLIYEMSNCESTVLEMMNRFENGGLQLSYQDRVCIYKKHLRYWNWILESKSIDLFFSLNVPHEGYDFVIYSLCKLKKIKTLYFYPLPINGTLMLVDDMNNPAQQLKEKYQATLKLTDSQSSVDCVTLMSLKFKKYYEEQTSLTSNPIPFYMEKQKRIERLLNLIRLTLQNRNILLQKSISPRYWKIKRHWLSLKIFQERKLLKFYNKYCSEPDISKDYIYLPLHFQPEATTSPLAGAFVDQLLIVKLLAYTIPKGVYIYVKEHPKQKIFGRNLDFYRELLSIPNVKLIPREYNSFALINNCNAVATATGTAGWEGFLRQKPVLMFGHYFYQYAPSVFQISNRADCMKAIDKIFNQGASPNLLEIQAFLKSVEEISIAGYVGSEYRKVSEISEQDNIKNLSNAVISYLAIN